jgi:hypothetical protein
VTFFACAMLRGSDIPPPQEMFLAEGVRRNRSLLLFAGTRE